MSKERYINASSVSVLLGEEYGYFWSTDEKIDEIIHGSFQKFSEDILPTEINKDTNSMIDKLSKDDLKITFDALNASTKTTYNDLSSLKVAELKEFLELNNIAAVGKKPELIEKVAKFTIIETLNDRKKEVVTEKNHKKYTEKREKILADIPEKMKKVVDSDFTMGRGNIVEERIIDAYKLHKSNDIKYVSFEVEGQKYKVGCRFDCDEQIEIKNRKHKFLGVRPYERVQVHFYMFACHVYKWILREQYADEIQDHEVQFSDKFYKKLQTDLHNNWEKYLE